MSLRSLIVAAVAFCSVSAMATDYYISTTGNDANPGSVDLPFATLAKAQRSVVPGDNVFIASGTYSLHESDVMNYSSNGIWAYVFDLSVSGTQEKPITYQGYGDSRPVFDFSDVKPEGKRIIGFLVNADYITIKGIEVVGVQVTIKEHTQSECFRVASGSHCVYENIACHDGMAIGFYVTGGSYNLYLNCDAYNNYDYFSEGGLGDNVDGFGFHLRSPKYVDNVIRGCRAWYNSDDGFDLIRSEAPVVIENCWAFRNGYQPNTTKTFGDGTGFKSGGYSMKPIIRAPEIIPRHVVRNCIAYDNLQRGFYSNHHLGGIDFINNRAYKNKWNFAMINRKSATGTPEDVPGYGHRLIHNISYKPTDGGSHIINIDYTNSQLIDNSFTMSYLLRDKDFESLDPEDLSRPRDKDGNLPEINFMKPRKGTPFESLVNSQYDVEQ